MARTAQHANPARVAGTRSAPVRKPLNLRVRPEVRALLDYGAALTGKTLTDFVLDAARQAAHSALLDRSAIPLNSKAYTAFVSQLDASPEPNMRLRRALQTPAVWE